MSEVFSSRMLEQDGEKTPELGAVGASAVVFFRLLFALLLLLPFFGRHLPSPFFWCAVDGIRSMAARKQLERTHTISRSSCRVGELQCDSSSIAATMASIFSTGFWKHMGGHAHEPSRFVLR